MGRCWRIWAGCLCDKSCSVMKQQTFALAAAWRGDWRGSREDEETPAWERLAWSPGEPGRKLGFGVWRLRERQGSQLALQDERWCWTRGREHWRECRLGGERSWAWRWICWVWGALEKSTGDVPLATQERSAPDLELWVSQASKW